MKKLSYIILSVAALALAVSCVKEDHAKGQKVTYYPVFDVTGGTTYAHQVGTPWADPGISATVNGVDITDKLEIDDTVDGSTSGVYTVKYSYTNEDGFSNSLTRTVVVYDLANASSVDIKGDYPTVTCQTFNAAGSLVRDWNSFLGAFNYKLPIQAGPAKGLFYVSDLMAGFYWKFYNGGYGSSYAYRAFILLNADNTISLLNGEDVDPFGDPIFIHAGGATGYDPVSGNVTIDWDYGGASHYVTVYNK
jgi:hypothetical protein